jgi:hypothetical protein
MSQALRREDWTVFSDLLALLAAGFFVLDDLDGASYRALDDDDPPGNGE